MFTDRQVTETAWVLLDRTPEERRKVFLDAQRNAIRCHPGLTGEQINRITDMMCAYVDAVYRELARLVRTRGTA